MTVKVKNVKVETISFDKKSFKDFDKCVSFVKSLGHDYKKYLPTKPKHKVVLELIDTTSDFANCIRRYLLDEIPVFSMDVDESNLVTDDKFILSDILKKNIELVPFQQNLTQNEINDLRISLIYENKTDELDQIYSRHITITDNKNKKLNNDNYFSPNIPLIKIRPNKSIELKNITISHGCGKQDSGKYCLLSNLSYEILDTIPFDESKFGKSGESSLNSDPRYFKISYTTHRNIEPKKIMIMCCDAITETFNRIQKELSNVKNSDKVYFSELLEVESKDDMKLFHFKNEYWTIANIISRYCYLEFKEIKFVCACITHPSIEESIVKIKHTEPVKIMSSAIKQILIDIAIVRKSFV